MINRNLAVSAIAAASYVAGALALKAAEKAGYLSHDTVVRTLAVFTGLGLAVYGNFLPKSLNTAQLRNPMVAMRMQSVQRVSGWAFTLGGLGYALTSLLPLPMSVSLAVLGSATAYVLGYFFWTVMECRSIEKRSA
jgi:hypothetical protein